MKIEWKHIHLSFRCGSVGKESACKGGDLGSIPGLGRSPGERKGYPLQYSGLENSMDCVVQGVSKSRTRLSDFHFTSSLYIHLNGLVTLQGDPTSPFWRRSALGFLWREWCWSWNSSTLATSCKELTLWKRLWCWEGLGAGGERDDRGWDGWMASPAQWTWVWVNSGSWWWTGRPGVLQFLGSQRVGHNWATELNWTEPYRSEIIMTGSINSEKNIVQKK